MSETHASGCFPCGWWKRREGTSSKADTLDRSRMPVQKLNVKEVEAAGKNTQLIPAREITTTEVRPSRPYDEAKSGKNGDVATKVEYVMEDTKHPSVVRESSVEGVEAAGTAKQPIPIALNNNTTEVRSSGLSGEPTTEAKPVKDVPTDMEYAMEAMKKGLTVLKGIADIVKFPLVKEAIELGISILDTCQTISDVQSGVQRLRDRITCLLLSVADATKEGEESDRLIKDLEDLKQCLAAIMHRLKSIASQNAFKSAVLSAPNLKIISDCEKDVQNSLERFQILRNLEAGQNIVLIQQQVATFYGVSLGMADNVEHIKHEVNDLRFDIKMILNGMKASKPMGATIRIPQLTSQLYGRNEVVQRIAEGLSSSKPDQTRICILAPGGMGKTSTALGVMHHSLTKATFGEDRYWVPCMEANSIDNFIAILFKHLKAENRTGDPLEDIMAILQESNKRRIILLDNFETPWRGIADGENLLKPILADLDSIPHISILMTMRSEWAPCEAWRCERLEPITPGDSHSLYTSIHPDACKYPQQLKELLDGLGHMPYAITLMASRGKRSGADPGKLLNEWRQKGTDMLSRRAEGINSCIELSIDSSYVRNSEDALRILQILSMLPAGVDQQDLSIWAGEWSSEAIETLRDTALIITRSKSTGEGSTTNHHSVLPVVQSYMAQKGRILPEVRKAVLDACYQFLRDNNSTAEGPNDPLFKKHLAAIASQEANLQALLTDVMKDKNPFTLASLSPKNHLDALLAYVSYQRWARPRLEIAEQVVSLARTVEAPRQEAIALFCLGHILDWMSKYNNARRVFQCAHAAFERVEDDLMALRSQLMEFEIDFHHASGIEPKNEFHDIRARWKDASSANPTLSAWLSYNEGVLHWFEERCEEAISIAKEAAETFDRLGLPYERSNGLYTVARGYAGLQDFRAALHHIDLVITLQNLLFGEGFKTPDLTVCLLMRVRLLKGMGCWDDEMETTLSAALETSRELGLSKFILLALLELGEVYVCKGDLVLAREAYEEAVKKGHGLDDYTSKESVADAKYNLKHIDYLCSEGTQEANFSSFQPPDRY